jgi:hypothetical protein
VLLGSKLELRTQAGTFRQGMFGPGYELSRFSARGLAGPALADELLPDGFSGYLELSLASGSLDGPGARVVFSGAAEHFWFGRTDLDAALSVRMFGGNATGTARVVASAIGQAPRYLVSLEARFRFAAAFYGLASAGTLYFPQPDRTLVAGWNGGLGFGMDFER